MFNARKFAPLAVAALASLASLPSYCAMPGTGARSGGQPGMDLPWTQKDPAAAPETKTPCHFFGSPRESDPSAQFARAQRLERLGSISSARKAYNALVHNWGASAEAPEAQYSVARLHEKAGSWEEAFKEYQYYLEHYSSSNPAKGVSYEQVVAAQFACANELLADVGTGPFAASYELVAAMFRKLAANAPAASRAAECVYLEAFCYEEGGADAKAVPVYERLRAKYPESELVADALYRAAFCRARLSESSPNDEQTLAHALQALRVARTYSPQHPSAAEAGECTAALSARLSGMAFDRAEFYERVRDNPSAAILAYEQFLEKYPAAVDAPRARERIAELRAEQGVQEK